MNTKRRQLRRPVAKVNKDVIFVLGAGVDRALGLPLMNTLFHDLNTFANGPGKPVDKALRSHAKNLRFGLDAYASGEGERLAQKLLGTHPHLLAKLQTAIRKHPDQKSANIQAIRTVLTNLSQINRANLLKEETVSQLSKMGGEKDPGDVDTLLDTQHMVFSPVARQAIKRFAAAPGEIPDLTPQEQEAFGEIAVLLSNFEEMMGLLFSGYCTKHLGNQKKYFYLSWLLWAYIREREQAGLSKRDYSFYKTLSEIGPGGGVITFNYTNFFCDQTRPSNGYFHGDCRSYIRFESREYVANDKATSEAKTIDQMVAVIEHLRVDWSKDIPVVDLPAFVPPLAVKPIICNEYLERWYECGQMIKSAQVLVILGYSFGFADEHFNDLIRKGNEDTRLVVINPSFEPVIDEVCRIIGQDSAILRVNNVCGLECKSGGRITFVKAKAEEILAENLRNLLG